jgi:ATP synthase protein I
MTNLSSKPTEPRQPNPWEDEAEQDDFKPLTRQEAQQWRQRQPAQSPWRVVVWQLGLWVVVTLLAAGVSGQRHVVLSVAYGGMCILLPTALMAYGLTASGLSRWVSRVFPGAAGVSLAGLFFWEGVKILLAVALMAAAPSVVPNLSWLALVAGLVVVLKAYWFAFWFSRKPRA